MAPIKMTRIKFPTCQQPHRYYFCHVQEKIPSLNPHFQLLSLLTDVTSLHTVFQLRLPLKTCLLPTFTLQMPLSTFQVFLQHFSTVYSKAFSRHCSFKSVTFQVSHNHRCDDTVVPNRSFLKQPSMLQCFFKHKLTHQMSFYQ